MWLACWLYSSACGGMSRQTEIGTKVEESRVFIDVRVRCDDVSFRKLAHNQEINSQHTAAIILLNMKEPLDRSRPS